jgi:anti-anti-sigma factor
MRRKVPFVGEERVERPEDAANQAKKARGHIIDDVLSTDNQASSWEDIVKPTAEGNGSKTSPSVTKPVKGIAVPITPGSVGGNANGTPQNLNLTPPRKGAVTSKSGSATIDWIPINNGHGLRINVCGMLDQNLREEWRVLLEETSGSSVKQFEFNLTQAPSLTLTGLGMLLMFKEQKGSERNDIRLCHCNKDVWQLLQWTGMDKYFTIQGAPKLET